MPARISLNSPLCLCILDGFGYSSQVEGNAIAATPTPTLDYLWSRYPRTLIKAAEEEVGLDFGQPGNSEVGHLSIGSGRVLLQHLARINLSINENAFYNVPAFLKAVGHVKQRGSKLHILGMVSATGVHAHLEHYLELIRLAAHHGVSRVYLHVITDGRDAGPQDSPLFLEKIEAVIKKTGVGKFASISGRETAMDRNQNWNLVEKYYNTILGLGGPEARKQPVEVVGQAYKQGLDDERIPPTLIDAKGTVEDGDAVIFSNYREDRARQITQALVRPMFLGFNRKKVLKDVLMVTMTQYEEGLPVEVAFPPENTTNCFADVIEQAGMMQFHVAETEKTAHVTYFFNGGREQALEHEVHQAIKSYPPEEFVGHPEMSAQGVTDAALAALAANRYQVLVVNYANADMIGHTGDFPAVCQAIAVIDEQINQLANAVMRKGGLFALTADHGNAEYMFDPKTGAVSKEHTINPVPFILAHFDWHDYSQPVIKVCENAEVTGILADVVPSILSVCDMKMPAEMTGVPIFRF
jgi:2,3-bisphosphoglycerate-independent phosphoglycerate mutase